MPDRREDTASVLGRDPFSYAAIADHLSRYDHYQRQEIVASLTGTKWIREQLAAPKETYPEDPDMGGKPVDEDDKNS